MDAKQEILMCQAKLRVLIEEHRDLDLCINKLRTSPSQDVMALQRLKKRKLALKDSIHKLKNIITPDILA